MENRHTEGGESKKRRIQEREREHEGDAGSGVSVCLLTKSLKSMAALMNISLEKLVQSSAGMNPLTANVIEHHLEATRDLKKEKHINIKQEAVSSEPCVQ